MNEGMSGIDMSLEKLQSEFAELKRKMSEQRKLGYDLAIAEMKIMAIPAKMQLARITQNSKDVQSVNDLLKDARMELGDARISDEFEMLKIELGKFGRSQQEENEKQEAGNIRGNAEAQSTEDNAAISNPIEKENNGNNAKNSEEKTPESGAGLTETDAKQGQSSIIRTTNALVEESYSAIAGKKYREALIAYIELSDIYKYLPKELKREVYAKVYDIYQKIIKSGAVNVKSEEAKREAERRLGLFRRLIRLGKGQGK